MKFGRSLANMQRKLWKRGWLKYKQHNPRYSPDVRGLDALWETDSAASPLDHFRRRELKENIFPRRQWNHPPSSVILSILQPEVELLSKRGTPVFILPRLFNLSFFFCVCHSISVLDTVLSEAVGFSCREMKQFILIFCAFPALPEARRIRRPHDILLAKWEDICSFVSFDIKYVMSGFREVEWPSVISPPSFHKYHVTTTKANLANLLTQQE